MPRLALGAGDIAEGAGVFGRFLGQGERRVSRSPRWALSIQGEIPLDLLTLLSQEQGQERSWSHPSRRLGKDPSLERWLGHGRLVSLLGKQLSPEPGMPVFDFGEPAEYARALIILLCTREHAVEVRGIRLVLQVMLPTFQRLIVERHQVDE